MEKIILSRKDIALGVEYISEYSYDESVYAIMRHLASLYADAPGPDPISDKYKNYEQIQERMLELAMHEYEPDER